MHITNVASHLGAWAKLQDHYPAEFRDLHQVAGSILTEHESPGSSGGPKPNSQYSPELLRGSLSTAFETLGWKTREELTIYGDKKRHSIVDAVKNSVGVEYTFGKFFYTESVVFVKFPLFVNSAKFKMGFVITPTRSVSRLMPVGIGSFEIVRDRIRNLTPLPLKYPFGIIGLSHEASEMVVEEFTSNLDQYLLDLLGYSLLEMAAHAEKPSYDFKETLSPDSSKLAKEICAFANLPGGGIILVGVDDDGDARGILRDDLDRTQLRIMNITSTSCYPVPEIECKVFDLPDDPKKCLLTIRITEVVRKPCMTSDKVYIRAGSAARPANSDEVRTLLIGTGA